MCDLCVDIGNYSEDLGAGPRGNDLGDIRVVKKFLSRDNQPGNCHSVGKFIFQAHMFVVTETAAALDINRKGKEIVCLFLGTSYSCGCATSCVFITVGAHDHAQFHWMGLTLSSEEQLSAQRTVLHSRTVHAAGSRLLRPTRPREWLHDRLLPASVPFIARCLLQRKHCSFKN